MLLSVFMNHIDVAAAQTGEPIEAIMDKALGMGIKAVECDAGKDTQASRALYSQLQKAGLAVANVCFQLDLIRGVADAQIEHCLDQVDALGCKQFLIVPGLFDSPDDADAAHHAAIAGLTQVCALAARRGMTALIEDFDHPLSPCFSIAQLQGLLEAVPMLGFTFDTGNFLMNEENELTAFRTFAQRIHHVHCKDRTFDPEHGGSPLQTVSGRTMYPTSVGSGCIGMQSILTQLKAMDYHGALTIEHFDHPAQLEAMRHSSQWLLNNWALA